MQHAILELIAVLHEPPSLHMFSEGLVSKAFLQGLGILMAWLPKPFFKALALCFLHLKKNPSLSTMPWQTCIFFIEHIELRFMVCHGCGAVCSSLAVFCMRYLPVFFMVFHGLSWLFMVCHGLSYEN